MADTNLLVLAREYKKLREEVKKVLSMPKGDKGDPGEKGEKGDKGDTGPQGFPGRDGKDGVNGFNGKDGRDGIDGKDGKDGLDGVGVANAYIDFDNSLVIVLTDGREVNAGFLSQETKENVVATFKQGAATINELLPPQEGNANKFLKTDGTDVFWADGDGTGTVTSVSGTGSVSGITLSGTVTNSGSLTLGGSLDLSSPPVIGNTTPNAATFTTLTATGQTSLGGAAGSEGLRVTTTASSNRYVNASAGIAGSFSPSLGTGGGTGGLALYANQGAINFFSDGNATTQQFGISRTTNAVNYVQVTGAATTGAPVLSAQGSDTNVTLFVASKGTGNIDFLTAGGTTRQYRVAHTAAAVNYLQAAGAVTNTEPVFSAQGSDTNISMAFQSKGTGGISLSTGSTGTNLVNGTSVTAITRTSGGGSYTSVPSVVISAPTTAGGVQATATCTVGASGSVTINNGGTGYTVGDTLTVVGGTGTATTIVVGTVSGGVITSYSAYGNAGAYSVAPTFPAATTGGTGSGATVTLNLIVNSTFTITNAGSGYVEQPTVTFSGGGGSGAAAYASVGTSTVIRGLGGALQFYTASGASGNPSFNVGNTSSGITANFLQTTPGGTGGGVFVGAGGSDTNVNTVWYSKGTGIQYFASNSGSTNQFVIAHTASAVNFVQVTGAATGGAPVAISSQGSDTNVNMTVRSKGTGYVGFASGGGSGILLGLPNGSANYFTAASSNTGVAPTFAVAGTDTNIDLALTPKGTGLVRFGTYTATALSIAGYIEIKDSGGTVRRLAVVA